MFVFPLEVSRDHFHRARLEGMNLTWLGGLEIVSFCMHEGEIVLLKDGFQSVLAQGNKEGYG